MASVYRLADGMFVNVTRAKERFAAQLTVPPTWPTPRSSRGAVAEARTATGPVVELSRHHDGTANNRRDRHQRAG